ncbi:MAG: IS110 family transposase [Terriglobales bacterium]
MGVYHPTNGPVYRHHADSVTGKTDSTECGKQIASYLGLVPSEESSGQRRRLGHITKQGNSLLRFLLVEAAQVTVCSNQEWRSRVSAGLPVSALVANSSFHCCITSQPNPL